MSNIHIESIQELLVDYLEKDINIETLIKQVNFKLKYDDPVLKGELTRPYIEMLSDYQESAYLAYLLITERKENLTYLTDIEKDALSLKFKIEPGSDIIKSGLENLEKFESLLTGAVNKMNGTQIVIVVAIVAGYLTVAQISDIVKSIETKKIEIQVPLSNIEREKELYSTFENMQKNLLNSRFDKLKQEAIHKPLYEYENNKLTTEEKSVTSKEALEMKVAPVMVKQVIKGVVTIDGIRGASQLGSTTTYWLIDENGKEFSIQLKSSEIDLHRKKILSDYMGKIVYIDLEINRRDGAIISKKIKELFTEKTHPEKFI